MKIKLPNINPIDICNPPENLEEIVTESFREYTNLTAQDFRVNDQLAYIDLLRKSLYPGTAYDRIKDLIMSGVEYQIDEYGDFPTKDDFWSLDFMEVCYEKGDYRLYDSCGGYTHDFSGADRAAAYRTLLRIISVVVNYKEPEEQKSP